MYIHPPVKTEGQKERLEPNMEALKLVTRFKIKAAATSNTISHIIKAIHTISNKIKQCS